MSKLDAYKNTLKKISDSVSKGNDYDDDFFDLYDMWQEVKDYTPQNDQEGADKEAILKQIKDLCKCWRTNHEQAQEEYERRFLILLESV